VPLLNGIFDVNIRSKPKCPLALILSEISTASPCDQLDSVGYQAPPGLVLKASLPHIEGRYSHKGKIQPLSVQKTH
jgi:hypothetical protein